MSELSPDEQYGKFMIDNNYIYLDFSEIKTYLGAEIALQQACDLLNKFNRTEKTDRNRKNLLLSASAYQAYSAAGYYNVFMFVHDKEKQEYRTEIPEYEKYNKLYHEVSNFGSHIKLWLDRYVEHNEYTSKKAKSDYSKNYKDVAIVEHGLKPYHVKMLIELCDKSKNYILKKYGSDKYDKDKVDAVISYIQSARNKYLSLNIFISDTCTGDPELITLENQSQLYTRVYNMMNDYFNAYLLYNLNKPMDNVDINILDKYELISKSCSNSLGDVLDNFDDGYRKIISYIDDRTKDPETDLPIKGKRLMRTIEQALAVVPIIQSEISTPIEQVFELKDETVRNDIRKDKGE